MKDNLDFLIGFGMLAVGLVGIGYGVGSRKKLNDICNRIDTTIKDISKDVEVTISDKIVEQAVNMAVEKEVKSAVNRATNRIIDDIESDIKKEVKTAVNSSYNNIKESVKDQVQKQVSRIDIDDLKRDVTAKAKEEALEKLQDNLDDILNKFNEELCNVSKIYKSISNAITKENDRSITLNM